MVTGSVPVPPPAPGPGPVPGTAMRPDGSETVVLDAAALRQLAELDPTGRGQLLARVLGAFNTSVARLRPQFDTARSGSDPVAIRYVAHTLKSSSAIIGASRLSQLCAQVEASAAAGRLDGLGDALDAMSQVLDQTLVAVKSMLENPP